MIFKKLIYLIFGCAGSWLLCWLSPVAVSRGYSLVEVCRPLILLLLQSMGSGGRSVVVAHKLSCPVGCGIFLDQGSNPCPPPWQMDS